PPLRHRERGPEILGLDPRRKPDLPFRTMIRKPAGTDKGPMARHRPAIMIAAFDLVKRIALIGMIPVMNGSRQDQRLFHHTLRHHMRRDLVLEPAHAFTEIPDLPCL